MNWNLCLVGSKWSQHTLLSGCEVKKLGQNCKIDSMQSSSKKKIWKFDIMKRQKQTITVWYYTYVFFLKLFKQHFFEYNVLISDMSHMKTVPRLFFEGMFQVVLDVFEMNFLVSHV